MAQMAGRASVEFYVGLALKSKNEREKGNVVEEAFVIRTFRNGLGVFVSKWVPLCCLEDLLLMSCSGSESRDWSCSSGRSNLMPTTTQ
jgi:hypothetical protein